ncbi:GspH/FimT family pseudopilin [Sphingomonas sp. AOB5]|uniref:GspH/FimT family pseudopilin n=1 Tax=Sphingomonas sp. AOB5 TaxID=3034017 RepID=UPI0023F7E2E5|nr:GspH/FimT family pseudopilin [Sphingomonas sp. AOB5]MDF7777718.1 GspH/FimT family pseudopilin [Sphingomonas sp. AOB5]
MPGGRSTRTARETGFTLVEMLIVLAIIAVAAGTVAIGVGGATRAPTVEAEARRLATRLQAASDDAMLGDRMVALTIAPDGYGFATIGDNGQMQARTDKALGFHQLPAGMVMTLSAKPPVVLGADGAGEPMTATVESGRQRWIVLYDGMTVSVRKAAEKP